MEVTHFVNPKLLWLLLLLLPMVALYVLRVIRGGATIQISTVEGVQGYGRSYKYYLRHLPFVLRCAVFTLLVIAIARPQNREHRSRSTTEGIDIMLAIDISTSMLARDLKPNRIMAAREVASKFIVDRVDDRIGIVLFAGESFTQSPLTMDKATLLSLMGQVRSGLVDDGTAIGSGLATAVNRLKDSEVESKIVILLTDGVNNRGEITPLTAAEIASTFGIRVYTIGVGSRGMAPSPAYDMWGNVSYIPQKVEIDEEVLTQIAAQTGGEYFRATDNSSLSDVYDHINSLERSKQEIEDYTLSSELFMRYAIWALILMVIEFFVRYLWLRRIP